MPTGIRNDYTPGVIKAEISYTQAGTPAANILHVGYTGGPPLSADLAALGAEIGGAIDGTLIPDWPATTLLQSVTCTDLGSDTGEMGTDSIMLSGTGGSGPSPAQSCVLVDWLISRRYRGGHPRTYWPGPDQGSILSPSLWNLDIGTDWATAMTALMAAVSGVPIGTATSTGLINVSYVDAGAWRVDNVVDLITGFRVSGLIRSQRRRTTATSY